MDPKQNQPSHLFLVRFWTEEMGEVQDRKELRGRVQHVLTGEAHTFHDWPMLIDLFLEMADAEEIEAEVPRNETEEA